MIENASLEPVAAQTAARGYVEDLLRNGRIQLGTAAEHAKEHGAHHLATHRVENSKTGRRLSRRLFD